MRKFTLFLALMFFIGMQVSQAQTRTISGTVTNAEDGSTIPGVSVVVKGTTFGTTTDLQGMYSLNVPQDAQTLKFSFIGMQPVERDIAGQTVINVRMEPTATAIEGVVVTALGITKERKALGYAVQEVSSEDLTRSGSSSLSSALQGKLSGVEIKPSSGMPGASSQIIIRGARSFSGNNTPLYVIDGMPVSSEADFSTGNSVTGSDIANRAVDIDPNDIESINILKGQAAAALYGIRASNGVVIITTKSGKGNKIGKPAISFSNFTSFETVSRTPDYQTKYAQGSYGNNVPNTSFSWGPEISKLPDDPVYGGNSQGHPGLYFVPQRERAGLDPWVKPQTYDNFGDFFDLGYTTTTSLNISQATEKGNIAFGIGNSTQEGIVPSTGMDRWNAKAAGQTKLNDMWSMGFSANYARTSVDKLPAANDASIAGVYAAPPNYDLAGIPTNLPTDIYSQIYYRSLTFDNPYWGAAHNKFNETTDRFFGNGFVEYTPYIADNMTLKTRYQIGTDAYTSHYQDIFEYGHRGSTGEINNYGISSQTINSLLTVNYTWKINNDFNFTALVGNEFNHRNRKLYDEYGTGFNFGGWAHMSNAKIQQADESQYEDRTVGFFGNLSLDYKGMLYFNATGRQDYVSTMPRDNNYFFYPSVSLGFVITELESLRDMPVLSFAKVRVSYAEVGQAGDYFQNFFASPNYEGGFWGATPIQYPIGGVSSYLSNNVQFDPNLKPQNTQSYELGTELKFFNNRLGVDYSYSHQLVTDQIFQVPIAASTGAAALVMNGGEIQTNAHEIVLYATPVATQDFNWDFTVNFSKIDNMVNELAPGVESIFLGGFVTPQVRAGIGSTFPVIYGSSFKRDDKGNILVYDAPGEWYHGMPQDGPPAVIGEVSPDFILGFSNRFTYKGIALTATLDWKQGGQMYSGSNGLLDLYGVSATSGDREETFVFDGYKEDGTPNDIVRGGPNDPEAYQDLITNVLTNIDEYYIHDNSFLKLREVTLSYALPKSFMKEVGLTISVYARNILLWTELPNFDPESSQGNNNMGGSFERFSMPQTTSYGFGINLNF
ncbi:MAG: SusC/RagA family TonB-linked outer membrane protein [Bacteroidales bacterium]|nr:SusC/RagA family TonB-linked outer membrane protein [Bacteroidales bacterium]MDD3131334.1 SusC/RagA family TonB-linked outer membrane protein [Bacteroidales bacterium]